MTRTLRLALLTLALVCGGLVADAVASTYYVATTGDDSRSCMTAQTITTPKRTIKNAVTCLSAGDTLLVRGGTYDEGDITTIPSGVSWASKVRIANYVSAGVGGCSSLAPHSCGTAGETVWITPTNANRVVFLTGSTKYIEFDGINMDGSHVPYGTFILYANGDNSAIAEHIRWKNAECISGPVGDGNDSSCVLAGAHVTVSTPGGSEFQNLTIHGGDSYGLYISGPNNLIEDCDIYNVGMAGVHVYNGGGDSADANIIRRNRIHDITLGYYFGKPDPRMWGVILSGNSNQVYNNFLYRLNEPLSGGNAGINIYTGSGNQIWNNTIADSTANGIYLTSGTGISGTEVKNNLVYSVTGSSYYDGGASTTTSGNSFGVNPSFVSLSTGDLHLTASSSVAIDLGTTLAGVTDDIDGNTRPQGAAYDIGADEYGATPVAEPPAPDPAPTPEPTPPPALPSDSSYLTLRAYKVRGVKRVDLVWTNGLATSTVDIYRNGAKLLNGTTNDLGQTDNIGRHGNGTYLYKVCEHESTDLCTNTATAAF
jgi:hypothetical protein